jgi:hypothetical protein
VLDAVPFGPLDHSAFNDGYTYVGDAIPSPSIMEKLSTGSPFTCKPGVNPFSMASISAARSTSLGEVASSQLKANPISRKIGNNWLMGVFQKLHAIEVSL